MTEPRRIGFKGNLLWDFTNNVPIKQPDRQGIVESIDNHIEDFALRAIPITEEEWFAAYDIIFERSIWYDIEYKEPTQEQIEELVYKARRHVAKWKDKLKEK